MNIGEVYEVEIEKLTSNGSGLAKIDEMVVFVENACPKDKLKIKITKINKHYALANIEEITKPSPHRIKPFCPMQKVCGACQLQFIDYDYQLELKRQIVKDTMHTIGGIDIDIPMTIQSPQTKNYRHKIQYPVSQTKNSKRIIAGYYKPSSHEIVNIKYCPIQPEICDNIIEYIRNNAPKFNISGYNEKTHSGDLRHVVIRHSDKNGKCLVAPIINGDKIYDNLNEFCRELFEEFEEISGVCVNFNPKRTNVILGKQTKCLFGSEYIEEEICGKTFRIGTETFFQINPQSAQNIFNYIKEFIKKNYQNPAILDAYAGISAIGICLSDTADNVITIEENEKSVELAQKTAQLNGVENIEIHGGDAEEFFKTEKRKFDVIILDPPRKGCSVKSLDYVQKLCKGHIVYVSCNPATLARDLKYLKEKGCKVESIQPFDMFCHTYHIECAAIIKV